MSDITCFALYDPERRSIVNVHRTEKDLKKYYAGRIPLGCVVVKMTGQYSAVARPRKVRQPK